MRKTWEIIKREYYTRVRKRSFLLFTILGPIFLVGLSLMPLLFMQMGSSSRHIIVHDESGLFTALPDSSNTYFSFAHADLSFDALKEQYTTLDNGYDAILYIPAIETEHPNGIQLISNEQLGISTQIYIENILADKLEELNMQKRNITREEVMRLRPRIQIKETILTEGAEEQDANTTLATAIGYIMGFMIYIVLLIYGTMVMRGVMEEKTTRIIEVIISSVRPFQLMLGKIIGLGLVGLTQFLIWGILLMVFQTIASAIFLDHFMEMQNMQAMQGSTMDSDMVSIAQTIEGLQHINFTSIILLFIFYFLGGYFLYASLFAAVGSLASEDDGSDIQMYVFPLTMLILVSIFIMMSVVHAPDSSLAFWATLIPFTSPIGTPAIIPFHPPAWQIGLSMLFLTGGFIFTTFLAGKVYRTAILMYGKKIRLRELIRWMFYKG